MAATGTTAPEDMTPRNSPLTEPNRLAVCAHAVTTPEVAFVTLIWGETGPTVPECPAAVL